MQKASTALPVRDKFSLISDKYLSVWKSEKKIQIKPQVAQAHYESPNNIILLS